MIEILAEIVKQHPDLAGLVVVVIAVWYLATNYSTFRYMRKHMVTNTDLENALLRFELGLQKKFVTKPDYHSSQPNGEAKSCDSDL